MPRRKTSSQCWGTPPALLKEINKEFDNPVDVVPFPRPEGYDALTVDWPKNSFANPPYNDLKRFVPKMLVEAEKGARIVALLPARLCAKYFGAMIRWGAQFRYFSAHLAYTDLDNSSIGPASKAPFASILVILDKQNRVSHKIYGTDYTLE